MFKNLFFLFFCCFVYFDSVFGKIRCNNRSSSRMVKRTFHSLNQVCFPENDSCKIIGISCHNPLYSCSITGAYRTLKNCNQFKQIVIKSIHITCSSHFIKKFFGFVDDRPRKRDLYLRFFYCFFCKTFQLLEQFVGCSGSINFSCCFLI